MKTFHPLRPRSNFLIYGTLLVIFVLFLSDPDLGIIQNLGVGAGTITILISVLVAILCIVLLHLARKSIFDYQSADFDTLLERASRSPEGAGMSAIAVSIMTLAFAVVLVGGLFLMK